MTREQAEYALANGIKIKEIDPPPYNENLKACIIEMHPEFLDYVIVAWRSGYKTLEPIEYLEIAS